MSSNTSALMKRIVLVAALAAGASGAARADDSSTNPFTGESYAAFNGGNLPHLGNPAFDSAPSAWRQANPQGLPERVLQSYSAPGEAWHLNQPVFATAAANPAFKQAHGHGLTEREMQALSSEAPAWQLGGGARSAAVASANAAMVAQDTTREPLGQRFAHLFHFARSAEE